MGLLPSNWSKVQAAHIVFWVDSLILILQGILLLRSLNELIIKSEQTQTINIKMKYANISCHCLIITFTLCDIVHALGSLTTHSGYVYTDSWVFVVEVMADIFYFFESVAVYSVLMYRLKLIFAATQFRLTRRHFTVVGSIITVQSLFFLVYVISLLYGVNRSSHTSDHQRNRIMGLIQPVLGGFITAVGWTLNIYLVWMMRSKLRSFAVENAIMSGVTESVTGVKGSSSQARGMIFIVTKQTILGVQLSVISQLFFTLQFITFATRRNKRDFGMSQIVIYLGRGIEGLYTQVLLDLSFGYSTNMYLRVCGKLHSYLNERHARNMRQQITVGIQTRLLAQDAAAELSKVNTDRSNLEFFDDLKVDDYSAPNTKQSISSSFLKQSNQPVNLD